MNGQTKWMGRHEQTESTDGTKLIEADPSLLSFEFCKTI